MNSKYNCVVIVIDCLRRDKCLITDTPTIHSLIKEGTFFDQAISSTSTTSPSFASILTGLYPFQHGIRSLSGYKLDEKAKTIAERLNKHGYYTHAEITGPLLPELGLNRGFDKYNWRKAEKNINSDWFDKIAKKFKENDFKEPWFVLLHLFELHQSQETKIPDYINGDTRYDEILSYLDFKLESILNNIDQENTLIILTGDHGDRLANNKFEIFFEKIKRGIKIVKEKLGLETPITNPSIGHGFNVYEPLIRVPLIFRHEKIFPKGKTIPNQVRQVDIYPTILDVLDIDFKNENIAGKSLLDIFEGEEKNRMAYIEACGAVLEDKKYWRAGVRSSGYKYIWRPWSGKKSEELYNLEADPTEENNIVEKKPKIAKKLRRYAEEIR
ncbi:hypothetical protein AKJ52_00020 [candidate division MSBL1 archaeon SCGC-AAA382C18]|uniref:Sulfatase N-terminal domain-containing protein n=1 Tax=candidate division MSBL1 archaeon SCGC-AAA382C18 TaxID=1698281 RepID=A0A133VM06_9EURY|nr:hypothetical protein AKJ52_00020 [candidate division MSBL1 archaeon SCGC-AAA382C18]